MATTLATILVGLGYDLSGLEKGSPEAFRLINQQTLNMSSQMKRNARDGAEAFRSIDEMIGIHINRPMTRLLVETFPAFGKALSSVLGGVAGGAVVFAGYELFDKVSKSIEKAQKAQEALREATASADKVFAEEMAAYKEKDKAVTAAIASADRLAEAEMKQTKAAQEASGALTEGWAAFGDWLHKISSFQSTLRVDQITSEIGRFKEKFDAAGLADSINKTQTSAALLANEISRVTTALAEMNAKAAQGHPWYMPGSGISSTELSSTVLLLKQLLDLQQVFSSTTAGVHNKDAEDALKKEVERIQEADAATQKWAESLKKAYQSAQPPKDQYAALDAEVKKSVLSLTNLQNRIGPISFRLLFDGKSLAEVEQEMGEFFGSKLTAPTLKLPIPSIATAPNFAAAAALPTLGTGGTTAAQFDVFSNDAAAKTKMAAQAYQDALGPLQQYNLAKSELNLLLKEGLIDETAYTAALQKAREEMAKSTDALEKMLEKGGLSGGWQAFKLQLEGQGSKGSTAQNTFDLLNKGLQGFEETTAQVLTGARVSWRSFFLDLDQMALKFVMNKIFASLLTGGGFSSLFGGFFGGGAGVGTNIGSISQAVGGGGIGLGSVVPGYAAGTDFAPGGLAWVGEQGPELMNVPAGASITPSSMLRSGAMPAINLNIDAKGAEIGVEEKIGRALSAALPHMVMRAMVEREEVQRRTPH
ncbi:MAG TPA: hypothetical protein VGT04_11000 [Acidobacteriaceae bacterium]|nr:hypothetical protein [Acidobacteriaceae bacterium]